jgi:Arabinose-binding domain of AraC transcription regulator, N-term
MRANDLGFRAGYSIALLGNGAVCMSYSKLKDFRSIPSVTGGIARLACARLRELGKDVKAVLSKAGLRLEEIADPTVRLEVRTQIKLLELAAEELRDDFIGFHLARSFDLRVIGLAYYVIASSEQLADALRNAEHYSRINTDGVRLRFKLDGTAVIALDYVNVDRGSDRHQIEF